MGEHEEKAMGAGAGKMTTEETLQACHALVWQHRAELGDRWPTPEPDDALAFAVTEVGEAVDAQLRLNPLYKRNSDREMDMYDELADVAMMLLTALGREWEPYEYFKGYPPSCLSEVATAVATAWNDALKDFGDWIVTAENALLGIINVVGPDVLHAQLGENLERIKAKHGQPA